MLGGLIALLTSTTRAQSAGSALALSLEEALSRALRASEEVELARHALESARGQQITARSDYFPQVSLSASYERTLASEFDVAFEAPPMAGGEQPGIDLEALPFGRENAYRAGATLTQNVFAGGRTLATSRAASELRQQAEIGATSAAAETRLATVKAYFDALLSDRFVDISRQTFEQAELTLEHVRLSSREGQESEFELLRAQVTLDNQRPDLVARRMQRELAYLRLRQQIGVRADQELKLTSSLEAAALRAGAGSPRLELDQRAPVRQAEHAARASEANVGAARSNYYPNLSLSMSYGRVHYPNSLLPSLDDWSLETRSARSERSWPRRGPPWSARASNVKAPSSGRPSTASSARRPCIRATSSRRARRCSPSSTRAACGSRPAYPPTRWLC